eukprot:13309039-Heterocapsa_arctica.AAC.1
MAAWAVLRRARCLAASTRPKVDPESRWRSAPHCWHSPTSSCPQRPADFPSTTSGRPRSSTRTPSSPSGNACRGRPDPTPCRI